ncbi:hypothetical protein [Pseudobacteroides cellulosolvens]|nr:hypothetical protein [Pseudobacteroides cellulosolvens]
MEMFLFVLAVAFLIILPIASIGVLMLLRKKLILDKMLIERIDKLISLKDPNYKPNDHIEYCEDNEIYSEDEKY